MSLNALSSTHLDQTQGHIKELLHLSSALLVFSNCLDFYPFLCAISNHINIEAAMTFSTRIPLIYGAAGFGAPGTGCKITSIGEAQPIMDDSSRDARRHLNYVDSINIALLVAHSGLLRL
ncbi:hypothetical protein K435DRAFT_878394 [Dendrothele bispora CBS 962.96]|uniref:Uncharacterized protein n=1 Tax=Dendrothele bispora (strain CBS 962.96) TaxID=1314807 RepID=A0A4S8KN87_DENBC|nr:hypothetical protein K435DRAFT_878394 [Dendrothele bispora CBS 962.96]